MPALTRWTLKTSLVYLLAALLVGLLQAVAAAGGPGAALPGLRQIEPVRVHLLAVGWITLLIVGVVYWMFPKYSSARPRGIPGLGWAAYGLLNAGLLLRVAGESAPQTGGVFGWLLVAAAGLQWLGGLAFVLNTWQRVRSK